MSAFVSIRLARPLVALAATAGLQPADAPRLAALHDQSQRLGRVVQDLADLSAAESAALSLPLVDADLAEIAAAIWPGSAPGWSPPG